MHQVCSSLRWYYFILFLYAVADFDLSYNIFNVQFIISFFLLYRIKLLLSTLWPNLWTWRIVPLHYRTVIATAFTMHGANIGTMNSIPPRPLIANAITTPITNSFAPMVPTSRIMDPQRRPDVSISATLPIKAVRELSTFRDRWTASNVRRCIPEPVPIASGTQGADIGTINKIRRKSSTAVATISNGSNAKMLIKPCTGITNLLFNTERIR